MKNKIKEISLRLIILLVGLTIAHFGVTLFILANIGTDTFNLLVQGVYRTIGGIVDWGIVTHGNVHMVMCLIIIAALLLIDRRYIKAGTIVCMLFGGPIIDMFTLLLEPLLPQKLSLWMALVMVAVGCVILAFGMTIVIKSEAGTGPNDLVSVVIADKLNKKFGIVRIFVDVIFVLAGFLLGGTVGIGTIVCAVLVGPVAEIFLPINEKWISKFILKAMNKN